MTPTCIPTRRSSEPCDATGWRCRDLRDPLTVPDAIAADLAAVSFVADVATSEAMGATAAVTKPVDWSHLRRILEPFRDAVGDVLVVDDDADTRERLRTALKRNGWSVREAGNGLEALKRVRDARPRVVLLDLTMPVMDGFTFLERLRDEQGCADVPVVVLNARDITSTERERLADANRLLRKDEASLRDLASEIRETTPPRRFLADRRPVPPYLERRNADDTVSRGRDADATAFMPGRWDRAHRPRPAAAARCSRPITSPCPSRDFT